MVTSLAVVIEKPATNVEVPFCVGVPTKSDEFGQVLPTRTSALPAAVSTMSTENT